MAVPIPYQPSNVILQSGNGQNLVTWDLVVGATSYSVQRSVDGVTFTNLGSPVGNSYLDTTCLVGTQYWYQVASVDGSGTSAYSASYPVSITPCLPGQMNLGYIRYLAQLRADKLNSQYLTTDEWNSNINLSINELYDILVTNYGDDYFFAPKLLIPLTGLESYPLPDGSANFINVLGQTAPAIYKLNGVDANISGGSNGPNAGWIPMARINWSDRDKYTTWPGQAGALNNIYQMSYRMMGNRIYIFPQNMNQIIRLNYVPILTQLVQDTDMLPFSISGWVEYIIVDAAMKAMIKEESLEKWNALQGTKAGLQARIEVSAVNKDVGQPNTVSNTRNTMGDPGFSNWGNGYGGGGFGGGGSGYALAPLGLMLNPNLIQNNFRYQILNHSIFIGYGFLAMLACCIYFSYFSYRGPIKFHSRIFKSRKASFFKNHILSVFSRGANK
jgi:hypothetical protein